jgi:hypothetical protein
MAKAPTIDAIVASLTVPERVLLFCLASGTDLAKTGVTQATVQHMPGRRHGPALADDAISRAR